MGEKLKRMVNIFFDPVKLFQKLREEKDWIFPLVVIIILALIAGFITYTVMVSPEMMEQMERQVEEDMAQQGLEGQEVDFSGMKTVYFVSTMLGGVLFALLTYLLIALILWLPGKFGLKEYSLGPPISVAGYIGIVGGMGSILTALLVYFQQDLEAELNLALFLPRLGGLPGMILENITIFGVWLVILISLALTVFYDLKKKKVFPVLFTGWILWRGVLYLFEVIMMGI